MSSRLPAEFVYPFTQLSVPPLSSPRRTGGLSSLSPSPLFRPLSISPSLHLVMGPAPSPIPPHLQEVGKISGDPRRLPHPFRGCGPSGPSLLFQPAGEIAEEAGEPPGGEGLDEADGIEDPFCRHLARSRPAAPRPQGVPRGAAVGEGQVPRYLPPGVLIDPEGDGVFLIDPLAIHPGGSGAQDLQEEGLSDPVGLLSYVLIEGEDRPEGWGWRSSPIRRSRLLRLFHLRQIIVASSRSGRRR